MPGLLEALDDALRQASESFVLRRVVGTGANVVNIDVTCRGRVDGVTTEEIAAGIKATDLKVIMSPTQINNAQWPGGTVPQIPPFNIDQRIPRENGPDKAIIRGQLRNIVFSMPFFINDELVRIELRVSG